MKKYKEVRKYMELFNGLNSSVIYIDRTFTIKLFGGEFRFFLKKIDQNRKKKIINSELFDVLPQLINFQDKFQKVFDTRKEETIEEQIDFDGNPLWLKLRLIYREDKNIPAIIVLMSDKTDQKKLLQEKDDRNEEIRMMMEEVERKNLELEKSNASLHMFFGVLAHDIKTPMNAIHGFAQLLSTGKYPDNKVKEFSDIIFVSTKNVLKIVGDLAQWIAAYSGQALLCITYCNPKLSLEQIAKSHDAAAEKKNISIVTDIPGFSMYSDESVIRRILDNLIANAIKFTRQDGRICISLRESEQEFIFCVEDNGVGIAPEKIEQLFKLEGKQDLSTPGTQGELGTGFGLIHCKALADLLQARIWCESKVGMGTSFFLAIPKQAE